MTTGARPTVYILTLAQALSMTGVSMVTLTTGLAGTYLAADATLATLPLAIQFLATMCSTFPAAMLMRRRGRAFGFTLGQVIGASGGAVSVAALLSNSFPMLLAGGVLFGIHSAFWGYYRFAAAEAADPAFRQKALSLVMGGGVLAAIAGPELAKHTRDLMAPVMFAGCYATIGVLCLVNVVLVRFGRYAPPAVPTGGQAGRPLRDIVAQPMFIAAVMSAAVGYAVMILVMAATPISMVDCGLTFNDAAFVIQWHGVAMFAPSFVTGALIQRFGALRIVLVGLVLNAVCMGLHLAGTAIENFWAGLFTLGLGWNFMYVGATSLLTECYRPEEREKAQAANDTMVFAAITVATFASGALQNTYGWNAVNGAIAVPLVLALIVVLGARRKSASA